MPDALKGITEKVIAALILAGILALFRMHDRITRLEQRGMFFHGEPTQAETAAESAK